MSDVIELKSKAKKVKKDLSDSMLRLIDMVESGEMFDFDDENSEQLVYQIEASKDRVKSKIRNK